MTDTESKVAGYAKGAYRRDAIPELPELPNKDRIAKAIEGGDFLERLPWANYAFLDISLSPSSVQSQQKRRSGGSRYPNAGPVWDHRRQPSEFIKNRWQMLFLLAGSFADRSIFVLFFGASLLAALIMGVSEWSLYAFFKSLLVSVIIYGIHLFFRFPFTWFIHRYPDTVIKDLGCGFFRPTGKVVLRGWREETFEAPFVEFDPYISFTVNYRGPVTYNLFLVHRYTGKRTTVASVDQTRKVQLYAHWDELQRYMDVSQPLPDVPALEPYRHLDPTTAEYDAAGKRGRPADYWKNLDLEWWEKEGYPEHMRKIEEFPWSSLKDRMRDHVPNLDSAAYV